MYVHHFHTHYPSIFIQLQSDRLEDLNNTVLPYPSEPIRFRTFPDSRLYSGSNFRFLASSCMTPNFPYAPLQSRRIKGFDLLANTLWPKPSVSAVPEASAISSSTETPESTSPDGVSVVENASENTTISFANVTAPVDAEKPEPPTEFMIFMGDFIYADVPVYYGDDQEAYRRFYRRNYNSPSFRKVYERLRESDSCHASIIEARIDAHLQQSSIPTTIMR